jgi:4'-phosphopantetheinyl transferase EntD
MSGPDLIAELLPSEVACVEVRGGELRDQLFPEEASAIAGAAPGRRQSFTTARSCARRALAQLGAAPVAIPVGAHGAPHWPAGTVGSITHCDGYRAAVVGRTSEVIGLGIDAEPCTALAQGVLRRIASEQERASVAELSRFAPETPWGLLLFSAKESVFKACHPLLAHELAGEQLAFKQLPIELDAVSGAFTAQLEVPELTRTGSLHGALTGRWLVRDGLVLTALALGPTELAPVATQTAVA